MTDVREFEALTELGELRRVASELQAKLRQAKAKTAELIEAAHDGARDAAVLLGNPPPVPKPPSDKRQQGRQEAAVLHLSDWQIGKLTDTYSIEIARSRVRVLAEKVAKIAAVERADHPVPELHLLLGGDLVEGAMIFPGQQWEIDAGLFQQTFAAVSALEELTRHLLSIFDRVHCWEVEGNHGRLGKRGDHPREDNADLFVYREARGRLAADEKAGRLVWHPRERWYQLVQAGEYRALLVHGDQVKQFGGNTPAFGIARKVNAWASGVVEPFSDCYMGHFHQPLVLPLPRGRVFINPSLESGSTFAQEFVASVGTPGQRLNFVDPARGRVTSERILWLDDDQPRVRLRAVA